jgi:hypothetical protein
MRGMNYTRATSSPKAAGATNSFVEEALAKQAALRPAKAPPKTMPITPTLPRIPKPHKRRRRAD